MSVYGTYIYENNNDFEKLIESYLNDDEIIEEGANLNLIKEFNKYKKEYKKALRELKDAAKKDDKVQAKEAKSKALHALDDMSAYISANKKELSSMSAGSIGTLITQIPTFALILAGLLFTTIIPDNAIPSVIKTKMTQSFDNEMKNLKSVKFDDEGKYYFDDENKKEAISDLIKAINIKNNINYKGHKKIYNTKNISYIISIILETLGLVKSIKASIRITRSDALRDNNLLVTNIKDNIKKLKDKVKKIPI